MMVFRDICLKTVCIRVIRGCFLVLNIYMQLCCAVNSVISFKNWSLAAGRWPLGLDGGT